MITSSGLAAIQYLHSPRYNTAYEGWRNCLALGLGGAMIPSLPAAPCAALAPYDAGLWPDGAGALEPAGLLVLRYLL